jgi:uncharacterized Rossmann fold enzyme
MEFRHWEPVYEAILADFGFGRAADVRARDLLVDLVTGACEREHASADDPADGGEGGAEAEHAGGGPLTPADLDFSGETVAIVGAAPSLDPEDEAIDRADSVVAASDAAAVVRDAGVGVDCLVTDLDADREIARALTREGTPVAVHAHGDNRAAVREHLPDLNVRAVLPTTQAAPAGPVHNPGGFTDGDRAGFLADHCGAAELTFAGWDFDDPAVDPMKRRKLAWAERLLRWLERRRDERFGVLDGRRADIDESALPTS